MNRIFNFSAGPSMLPLSVLEKAASEMVCYGESGMSVMEMSHRSADYDAIIKKAEADLREIMEIPDNYKVLFLQGGASTQFAAVPLNLSDKANNHSACSWLIAFTTETEPERLQVLRHFAALKKGESPLPLPQKGTPGRYPDGVL